MDIIIDDKRIIYDDEDEMKITGCVFFLNGYPAMKVKRDKWKPVYLHRVLTGARGKERVQFKNGNRLDLRKENLKVI